MSIEKYAEVKGLFKGLQKSFVEAKDGSALEKAQCLIQWPKSPQVNS